MASPTITGTALAAAVTALGLFIPDAYLALFRNLPVGPDAWHAVLGTLVFAVTLTLTESRVIRGVLIGLACVLLLLWTGLYAYSGVRPTPAAFILGQLQMHEVTGSLAEEWPLIVTPVLAVLAALAVLIFAQFGPLGRMARRIKGGGVAALLAAILAFFGYSMAFGAPFSGGLNKPVPALAGSFSALANGGMLLVKTRLLPIPSISPGPYKISPAALPEEPLTVVLIIGESVSPDRLSLFGFDRDTTPELKAMAADRAGPGRLYVRSGFSAGVATWGSVPLLLNMQRVANDADFAQSGTVNLFNLAHQNGFATTLFTSQILRDATYGKPKIDRLVSTYDEKTAYEARREEIMVDLLETVPVTGKQFVVIHQRVNHTPYPYNCDHLPSLNVFDMEAGSLAERRRASYDNGSRCLDRVLAGIFRTAAKRPGAVAVFYISDHGELMGETGKWGHIFTDLRVALVPVMLFTKQPAAGFDAFFQSPIIPSAFEFLQLVTRALGSDVSVPAAGSESFHVNGALSFGKGGLMVVRRTADPRQFEVGYAGPDGVVDGSEMITLPPLPSEAMLNR